MSNFIDYVKIHCKSGKGGAGSKHLRREKFVQKGGPDGGNGGRGGHIILKGNNQLWTLLHLKYKKNIKAGNGSTGGKSNSSGISGKDIIIQVPLGTIIKNATTGSIEAEITSHEEKKILIRGGRGGLGNSNFKSSTNQTPRYAQPGEDGSEGAKIFELKILADVGLVGFPNAGKSTLLSVITSAKPEIANYPFTTLTPNLGIVNYRNYNSFVMADIPGIIEGASTGKGLGLRFLRHIERNSILLFIIAADSKDIKEEYNVLIHELERYNPDLLDKDKLLAISKSDLLDLELKNEITQNLPPVSFVFISSIANEGLSKLKDLIWTKLNPEC